MTLSKSVLMLFAAIALTHIVAILNFWYYRFLWLDIPMHFAGGAWLALLLFWIFEKRRDGYLPLVSYWMSVLLVLGFVALGGVFWEFFEFIFDVLVSSRGYAYAAQLGTADTMADLFFDLLGGLAAWFAVLFFRKS